MLHELCQLAKLLEEDVSPSLLKMSSIKNQPQKESNPSEELTFLSLIDSCLENEIKMK